MFNFFKNISITTKFFLASLLVWVIFFAYIILFYPQQQQQNRINLIKSDLQNTGDLIAFGVGTGLENNNRTAIKEAIKIARNDPNMVMIRVFEYTSNSIDKIEEYKSRIMDIPYPFDTKFQSQLRQQHNYIIGEGKIKQETHDLNNKKTRILEAVIPVTYNNKDYGYIQLAYSLKTVYGQINKQRQQAYIIFFIIFLIGIFLTLIFSRKITSPIVKLRDAAKNVASGNTENTHINIAGSDEVSELCQTFNEMVEKVDHSKQQLQNANTKLQAVLETVGEGILTLDTEGNIVNVNKECENIWGYKKDEMLDENLISFIPNINHQLHGENIEHYNEVTISYLLNERLVLEGQKKDGTLFPVEVLFNKMTVQDEKFFSVAARDITETVKQENEKKEAVEALREREELYRIVLESLSEGLLITDTDDKVIYSNSRIEEITGYTPNEVIGDYAYKYIAPKQYWDRFSSRMEDRMQGKTEVYEEQPIRKDGSRLWIQVSAAPLKNTKGEIIGTVAAITDVTEKKKADEEIEKYKNHLEELVNSRTKELSKTNELLENEVQERKSIQEKQQILLEKLEGVNQELERSNQELEQFAYVASHDLREPLRMISSYIQLFENKYKDMLDKNGLDFIHYIVDGSKRMHELINALLEYSRVGKREKELKTVDCNEILETVKGNLEIIIEENDARIEYNNLPQVKGDHMQLVRLFQNLITNAIKFKDQDPPFITINAQERSKDWLFSVSDNGIGIDEEHFKKVFLIFQRLHIRNQYAGTGIGLAVCKKIIERHGGTIWVESEEQSKGSTFLFTIPFHPPQEQDPSFQQVGAHSNELGEENSNASTA